MSGPDSAFIEQHTEVVELDDGSLLTVWYELMAQPRGRAVLRQARWRLA